MVSGDVTDGVACGVRSARGIRHVDFLTVEFLVREGLEYVDFG